MHYRTCADLPSSLGLDELSSVPWGELRHALGPATDVPDQLRAYAGSPTEHEWAARHLYGTVFHQGSRYTASAFTVPFFIGLLDRPDLRLDIVERLRLMAHGYEEGLFPGGYDVEAADADQRALDDSPNRFGHDSAHTHHAVCRAWPQLIVMLDDEDSRVRAETAHLFAYLPNCASASIDELVRRLSTWEEDALASALLALGVLGRQQPGLVDLASIATAENTIEAHVATWCARSLLGDISAVDRLIDALGADLPAIGTWLEGSTLTLITAAIGVHEHWLTPARVDPILQQLRRAPVMQAPWVASLLVSGIVPANGLPELATDLSEVQRLVLDGLHSTEAWAVNGAMFVNWSSTLDAFLVPSGRESLSDYLNGRPLSDSLSPRFRDRLPASRSTRGLSRGRREPPDGLVPDAIGSPRPGWAGWCIVGV